MQAPPTDASAAELALPVLLLCSREAGWEGLRVQVFREPRELEGRVVPVSPNISLMLVIGGALHAEWRQAWGDPWEGQVIQSGELMLDWGVGPAYEFRWRSLSKIPTRTLNLQVSREVVTRVAEEVAGLNLANLELVRRAGFRDPLLTQITLALWRELEEPTPVGKLYASTAAPLLVVHLVRHYMSTRRCPSRTASPSPSGLSERQIRQVLEFIHTHLSEDLSLEVLAQQMGFSPYHFVRLFRRALGASPHQVVLCQRIERAQQLLDETTLPLANVARESGFSTQSYFTRVFKRSLGMTPRAYRLAGPAARQLVGDEGELAL